MDLKSFTQAIQQIEDEKGIPKEKILEAIELALAAAYKRDYGKKGQIVRAKIDPATGKVTITQIKIAVDETMIKSEEEVKAEEEERQKRLADAAAGRVREEKEEEALPVKAEEEAEGGPEAQEDKKVRFNPEKHIMIAEALAIKPDIKLGEELEFQLEYHEEYGRIAAQTAKQVIIQRIREVERETVFEEYKGKEGEIISGLIQRVEGRNVFVDIGRTVGIIPPEEQIPYERYHIGTRIKTIITLVEKNPKGPGVFLSRTHPRIIKKLFELEVPEIDAGTVEIKAIAREPGSRSKVAVVSHEDRVDPVGSLVGQKGIRVSTVINEIGGEKIDVIEWRESPAEFIANSLSPAKVLDVELSEKGHEARALVPDEQLSLAIGRGGQNVRLAAKLTGWKIDVRSSKEKAAAIEKEKEEVAVKEEHAPDLREAIKEAVGELEETKEVGGGRDGVLSKERGQEKEGKSVEKKPKKKSPKKSQG